MVGTAVYVARFRIKLINSFVAVRMLVAGSRISRLMIMNRINYNGRYTMTNSMSKSKNFFKVIERV